MTLKRMWNKVIKIRRIQMNELVLGILDLILQSMEYVKNEDTSYAEVDMTD